jgi:hypothetical protein
MTLEKPGLSAALPARTSAFSLPGVPSCPLTQTGLTVLSRSPRTILYMLHATFRPGPEPVWFALAVALVESKWMVICCHSCPGPVNQETACSIAASSASKAVCSLPILRRPSAMVGPAPLSSLVTIHPNPAASRKEPSVQAWQRLRPKVHGVLSQARGVLIYGPSPHSGSDRAQGSKNPTPIELVTVIGRMVLGRQGDDGSRKDHA